MTTQMTLAKAAFWTTVFMLAAVGKVNAATVVLDGTTATGITGLEVNFGGGVELYDVDFIQTTAASLYGNPPASTFPFTLGESGIVNDAILAALNGSTAVSVGPTSALNELDYAFMHFSSVDDRGNVSFLGAGGSFVFGGTGWVDASPVTADDTSLLIYADFSPAVIPVPAAVWLFGSGLLGLIGIARRKRAA
jgi:hypothetical protein